MTFGFYLRNAAEMVALREWNEVMRQNYGEFWLFSAMESKPSFMKEAGIVSQQIQREGFQCLNG